LRRLFHPRTDAPLSGAAENSRFKVGPWRKVDASASLFHREKATLRNFSAAPKLWIFSSQSKSFQDLRAKRHDTKQEKTGGNPPSGHKKPELPCPVLFTPRSGQQNPSGAGSNRENKSWNCASI
jgi:hypothetical protein